MSVLIKGMEMYERCSDPDGHWACPLFGSVYPHGVFCKENKREIEDPFSRQPWCPLVEVPPHGDLIDRDELEYHADNVRDPMGRTEKTVMWKIIEAAPTIIPADPAEEATT